MTIRAQQNPFQAPIQAAQQPPAAPMLGATTQITPAGLPTSPISSNLDSKERLHKFFNWVKRRPNWVTPKLIIKFDIILNTLINNFYNLEALRLEISK